MDRRQFSLPASAGAGLIIAALAFALPAFADTPNSTWIVETHVAPLATAPAKRDEQSRALDLALAQIRSNLRRDVVPQEVYRNATAGFALSLTQAEADALAQSPAVRRVTPDASFTLESGDLAGEQPRGIDRVAEAAIAEPLTTLIGAVDVWNGAAPDGIEHLGEGVIVGVLGEGIRGAHPSFAAVGDDGYEHINPYGSGVYVGECFATPEIVCNDKLIGRYNYVTTLGSTSEDEFGYSTYLASVAAGNRLSGETVAGTGLEYVAGVAPHANIIAYRTCASTCLLSNVIMAMDQAIDDGVDVMIYPIGSNSDSPWTSLIAQVARSLRAAGVIVVSSTGSSGPAPGTLNLSMAAPWVVNASSSTHGADFFNKTLGEFAGGVGTPPAPILGRARGEGVTARIVYAGAIPNPAAPGQDPAQCLTPYPTGVLNGEILVCDRGEISRVQKSVNALDSGAGGFVLANTSDGLNNLAADTYALPGVHIDADSAAQLRAWLATGQDHRATIGAAAPVLDAARADQLSASASRGPNLSLSYLAPTLTAPSFDIVGAALAPELFRLFSARGNTPTAGALALLQSAQPNWTVAEGISALMSTAVAPLNEVDGQTATGPFDHGAGRIDVAAATRAGLVLDITDAQFAAADPELGGRPQDLNLPALVDLNCVGQCSFTRTVRATTTGAWSANVVGDGLLMDVQPAEFALAAGESTSISVTVSVPAEQPDANYASQLVFVPTSEGTAATAFPVAVAWRADTDADAIADALDNCVQQPNADQRDTDGDGFGNACDADLNNDLRTNVIDLGLFRLRIGTSDSDADLNGDGVVDQADLARLGELFLRPPGPSGVQ